MFLTLALSFCNVVAMVIVSLILIGSNFTSLLFSNDAKSNIDDTKDNILLELNSISLANSSISSLMIFFALFHPNVCYRSKI